MKKIVRKISLATLAFLLAMQVAPNVAFNAAETNENPVEEQDSVIATDADANNSKENNTEEEQVETTEAITTQTAKTTSNLVEVVSETEQEPVSAIPASEVAVPTVDYDKKIVYANGTPITIVEGNNGTKVYYYDSFGTQIFVDFSKDETTTDYTKDLSNYTIFGGAKNSTVANTSITHKSGYVGEIYGGGHATAGNTATVLGNVEIYIINGASSDVVYGGGYAHTGTAVDTGEALTEVKGNVIIDIRGSGESYAIYGGGYANAHNGNAKSTINASDITVSGSYNFSRIFGGGMARGTDGYLGESLVNTNTSVNVFGNVEAYGSTYSNQQAIFGGGYAVNNYSRADVLLNTNVSVAINDYTNISVYGGGFAGEYEANTGESRMAAEEPSTETSNPKSVVANVHGTTTVNVSKGYYDSVYGGGLAVGTFRQAKVLSSTNVNISDTTVNAVYGGGVSDGEVVSEEKYESRPLADIGKAGQTTNATNVNLSGKSFVRLVAGGGYADNSSNTVYGNTNIDINTTTRYDGSVVYGGGVITPTYGQATIVGNTNVNVQSDTSTFSEIYGGGGFEVATALERSTEVELAVTKDYIQAATTVTKSTNVTVDADAEAVYGGANAGSVEENTNVIINGGMLETVYGSGRGNALTQAGSDESYEKAARESMCFVAGYVAGNTHVTVNAGDVSVLFGAGGYTSSFRDDVVYGSDYVGYSVAPGDITENPFTKDDDLKLEVTRSTEGGNTNLKLNGGNIGIVIGGAYNGAISKDTNIVIDGSTIQYVFGGTMQFNTVEGNTNITMYSGKVASGDEVIDNILPGIYGGGLSAKVGYLIDDENQFFTNTYKTVKNDGYGNATIKVFGGEVATASTDKDVSSIIGSGMVLFEVSGEKYSATDSNPFVNSYSINRVAEEESGVSDLEFMDMIFPSNNGDVFIFVDHDVTFEGNAYKEFFKAETVNIDEETIYDLKTVNGDATIVIDQPMKTIDDSYTVNGAAEAQFSAENYTTMMEENDSDVRSYVEPTGTGLECNGESLNILRQEQRGSTEVTTADGQILEACGENGEAWTMPHWSIQGDVELPDDVTKEITIEEKQELYIPNDASLTIPGTEDLNNVGYIVTAKGFLGRGIENGEYVDANTSNEASRIYRGDAINSVVLTPVHATYTLNEKATAIESTISDSYAFLLEGDKIKYDSYTWKKDGQIIEGASTSVMPSTDTLCADVYSVTAPYDVMFESVPSTTGLVTDGSATALATVNVTVQHTVTYPGVNPAPEGELPEDSFVVDHKEEVIIDNNDGTPPKTIIIEKDTTVDEPTRDGYTFEGYEYEPTTNTLTATWTENEYTVSFEENGGSEVEDQDLKYKDKVQVPQIPTKEGFVFEGWYLDKELTEKFDFETMTMPNHDLVLYAKYVSANAPETGDNTITYMWTGAMALAVVGVLVLKKKKEVE